MTPLESKLGLAAGELDAYPTQLQHMLGGREFMHLIESPARARHQADWRNFLQALIKRPPSSLELVQAFHTQWHVCHHRLRELVNDDDLLLDAARAWLPAYAGSGLTLYRGENIDRHEAGRIGSAWSDSRETAHMFASGLNAVGRGGVVLEAFVAASAIISGPSKHSSRWLNENEFTVDTRSIVGISETARFPARVL